MLQARPLHVSEVAGIRRTPTEQPTTLRQLGAFPKHALSLVMVRCLLVYRLAEHRLRQQLAATGQTVPDQLKRPTSRPTMRWVFQCFEGIELLYIRHGPHQTAALIFRLTPLHQQILACLGPAYE